MLSRKVVMQNCGDLNTKVADQGKVQSAKIVRVRSNYITRFPAMLTLK